MKLSNRSMEYLYGFMNHHMPVGIKDVEMMEDAYSVLDDKMNEFQELREEVTNPIEGLKGQLKNWSTVADVEDEGPDNELNDKITEAKEKVAALTKEIKERQKKAMDLIDGEQYLSFSDEFLELLGTAIDKYATGPRQDGAKGIVGRIEVRCVNEITQAIANDQN